MTKSTKIKTNLDKGAKIVLSGWLDGKHTYLWFGASHKEAGLAVLSGNKLYRLAKAIVRQFEK